jgi:hypothetical protein
MCARSPGSSEKKASTRDRRSGSRGDRAADQVSERLAHLLQQRCRRHEEQGVADDGVGAAGRADAAEHDAGRHAVAAVSWATASR